MNEQEGIDFLLVEHGKTLDLIQHYDNIRVSHMKFTFSYHSVVGTVAFALYRYFYINNQQSGSTDIGLLIFLGSFLILAFLVGFATLAIVAQNRSYFVIAARHANTIRGVLFKRGNVASGIESVFPTDPNEPKMFNPKSTHLVTLFLLEVVNSISFGFGILFFIMAVNTSLWLYFFLPIICGLLLLIGQFLLVKHVFLKEKSS